LQQFSIQALGDTAIKMKFFENVSPELNKAIQLVCHKLELAQIDGVIEWVPAYDSVTIYYSPLVIFYDQLRQKITELMECKMNTSRVNSRLLFVPVCYGGNFGPDLNRVAAYNHCSIDDVIDLHQKPNYLVYMLGFLPGFPYLGGLDPAIATPRLETPRPATFAGAVGIAKEQTGIYPSSSPGGWNIIGKTPLQLFQKRQDKHSFLFQAGDYVRFYSVSESEFYSIQQQIKDETFHLNVTSVRDDA